jgi:hypothetical protein
MRQALALHNGPYVQATGAGNLGARRIEVASGQRGSVAQAWPMCRLVAEPRR